MYTFFVILFVICSLFLIMVVLLQSGKGADMGAAFGGSSQTMFGARGQATFIQKLTVIAAVLFMTLSVVLASLSTRHGRSGLENEPTPPPGKEAGMQAPEVPQGTSEMPAEVPAPAAAPAAQPAADQKPVDAAAVPAAAPAADAKKEEPKK
jgi:preprotein translocase subunit SecG